MPCRRLFALSGTAAALAAVAVPTSSAQAAERPARVPVVVDCAHQARVRPASYVITCADANDALAGLRWSSWQPQSASATGRQVLNDCVPNCVAGRYRSYPVTVRLDRVRPWAGHPGRWQYGRLLLRYTAQRPPGTPRQVTFPLWS
ncbi:hypothetical protein ACIQGZ_27225 [Streptomyces sp. NPDC092296]|uniref:hypothetical protein n=1 Tax=Streptomyces sp. NPDC092296 TaxID=3366012 RepID=UPI0038208B6E